jgi:uncharacterized protein (TIGR03067 family)
LTSFQSDGAEVPSITFDNARIEIGGDRFVSLGMGATYEGTVVIDATKKPKALDLVFTAGHAEGTRNLGIYRLDGDQWTLCLATTGTRRPRAFATKPDSGLALETFQRATSKAAPAKSSGKSAAARVASQAERTAKTAPVEVPAGPATSWEGEWEMLSGIFSGVPMAENMLAWVRRVTRGDITEVTAGPQTMLRARFTLDESTTPARVEYDNLAGSTKGKKQSGIAELTGDTLRICMAAPGKPSPDTFASQKGDGRSLTVWRPSRT